MSAATDYGSGQPLYERDFYEWSVEQAAKLRSQEWAAVDSDNVAEKIESLGRSEKRELFNRLEVVLLHLLQWKVQPQLRSGSWRSTILEQRSRIHTLLDDSPSPRNEIAEAITRKYPVALRKAVAETAVNAEAMPAECPFEAEQVLDYDFLPE